MTSLCNRPNKHTSPTAIRFFKIILRDGNFMIPKKFTRKYGGGLSNPVFLKPPDGTEWEVYWSKQDGEIWFQKGWKEFTRYYSLDHGHLVLFEYQGTSHIEVRIFDMSTVEIEYPKHSSSTHDEKDNLDHISVDSVEMAEPHPCQKIRPKTPMPSPQPREKLRLGTTEGVSNLQNMLQHVQNKGSGSQWTNFEKPIVTSVKQELNLNEDMDGRLLISRCPKVKQSTTKITESLNEAATLKSRNPSFRLIMKPAYVHGYSLHIPSLFAEIYMKKRKCDVLLQVLNGRTWSAVYSFPKIKAGWNRFASDNNLNVGDVCVFELNKSQGLSFKVSISRVEEEPCCPIAQYTSTDDEKNNIDHISDDSVEILDELPPCKKTRLKLSVSSSGPRKRLRSGVTGDVNRSSNPQNLPWKAQKKGCKSQGTNFDKSATAFVKQQLDGEMLRRVFTTKCPKVDVNLLYSKTSEALRKATTFKSKSPSFMLVMKPYYVNGYSLNIPKQFAENYLKEVEGDVVLQVLDGRTWPASYGVQKISNGWRKFASDNNLKVGDVCVFELTRSRGLLFKVFIFRINEEPSCPLSQGEKKTQRTSQLIRPAPWDNQCSKRS